MTTRPEGLSSITDHPAFPMAAPTPEHFLPLAYVAGLSSAAEQAAGLLVEGGTLGSLTMTSYVLGCEPTTETGAKSLGREVLSRKGTSYDGSRTVV